MPRSSKSCLDSVCAFIDSHAPGDLEKARGVYYWIAKHVRYDMIRFVKGKLSYTDPEAVFRHHKAVCAGYSTLFVAMCKKLNLEAQLIAGYDKGFDYKPGSTILESTHAWNVVKIGGVWRLVDATWGAGYGKISYWHWLFPRFHKSFFVRHFDTRYFDTPPKEFVLTHLPELSLWQLLETPVSLKLFNGEEGKLFAFLKTTGGKYKFDEEAKDDLTSFLAQDITYGRKVIRFNPGNPFPLIAAEEKVMLHLLRMEAYEQDVNLYRFRHTDKELIDSVLILSNELEGLLAHADAKNKKLIKKIKKQIKWNHRHLCELYEARFNNCMVVYRLSHPSTADSLLLCSAPALFAVDKALEESRLAQHKMKNRELGDVQCGAYGEVYADLKKREENEPLEAKRKKIQKDLEAFVVRAKKATGGRCDWMPGSETQTLSKKKP